jgi:predicted metal-binding protein
MTNKTYIAIVQCHIVKERCSGYFCEQAFHRRTGDFAVHPKDRRCRTLYLTCGGCCGRAVHRKLKDLVRNLEKARTKKDRLVVHLSSCITRDSYHGPPCPHLDYLRKMIGGKLGLDVVEGTTVSKTAEKRRKAGRYES